MHDIEAVQKRPGMYLGDTADGMGLHNMLFEVIGNSINEGLAGHCTAIEISINPDGSATVRDNGRGISFERHQSFGKSAAEVVFTCLYPDFRRSWRSSQKRIHGVGLCVVNALSDKLECLVTQNGKEYLLRFRMGYLEGTLATCDKTVRQQSVNMLRGTEITFLPSQRYFSRGWPR